MLSIQDADAMSSQLVRDVLEANPELGNGSLFGPGLGDAWECDTVQSCIAETDFARCSTVGQTCRCPPFLEQM